MSKPEEPLFKIDSGIELRKSIFPPFNLNVPMPQGTPIPPVVIVTTTPSGGAAPTSNVSPASSKAGKD